MKHKPIIIIGIIVAVIICCTQFSDFTNNLNPREKQDGFYSQKHHSNNLVIEKRNLVIKYWNPKIIRSINEASNQETEQLSDYMKAWAAVENFYDDKGDRVVHIVSTDQDKILMDLTDCLQTKTM